MAGTSRRAYHGVPRIIADSCPSFDGLVETETDQAVAKYLKKNRINLSIRQVYLHRENDDHNVRTSLV